MYALGLLVVHWALQVLKDQSVVEHKITHIFHLAFAG
jgi:hypothetical protein